MPAALDDLTLKEKETLRLIARGHDAKSAARELGLSVHTINERLRAARRKLEVTSSREAARRLLSIEAEDHKQLVSRQLGDAPEDGLAETASTKGPGRRRVALWIGGVVVMLIFALALALAPTGLDRSVATGDEHVRPAGDPASAIEAAQLEEWRRAALDWLALVDQSDWEASFAAAGESFQKLNTVAGWKDASMAARVPLGAVVVRRPHTAEYVAAPPYGYVVMEFRTDFSAREGAVEKVTLEREAGGWKVVGYVID